VKPAAGLLHRIQVRWLLPILPWKRFSVKPESSDAPGREELTTVASVFFYKHLKGKNIAIITHAGGPAVMLTDALSAGGMNIT